MGRLRRILWSAVLLVVVVFALCVFLCRKRGRYVGVVTNSNRDTKVSPLCLHEPVYVRGGDSLCVDLNDGTRATVFGPACFRVSQFRWRRDHRRGSVTLDVSRGTVIVELCAANVYAERQFCVELPHFTAFAVRGRSGFHSSSRLNESLAVSLVKHSKSGSANSSSSSKKAGKVRIPDHCRELRVHREVFRYNGRRHCHRPKLGRHDMQRWFPGESYYSCSDHGYSSDHSHSPRRAPRVPHSRQSRVFKQGPAVRKETIASQEVCVETGEREGPTLVQLDQEYKIARIHPRAHAPQRGSFESTMGEFVVRMSDSDWLACDASRERASRFSLILADADPYSDRLERASGPANNGKANGIGIGMERALCFGDSFYIVHAATTRRICAGVVDGEIVVRLIDFQSDQAMTAPLIPTKWRAIPPSVFDIDKNECIERRNPGQPAQPGQHIHQRNAICLVDSLFMMALSIDDCGLTVVSIEQVCEQPPSRVCFQFTC